jgi:hypothetical protein
VARWLGGRVRAPRQILIANLLFDLAYFHKKEKMPASWIMFDTIGKQADHLVEDFDGLGGLVAKVSCRRR